MKKEFVIDLRGVRLAKTVHRKLAEALPFPADYGHNFDALFDFLTEYGADMKLVFKHAKQAPEVLARVCRNAAAATPGLDVVFE